MLGLRLRLWCDKRSQAACGYTSVATAAFLGLFLPLLLFLLFSSGHCYCQYSCPLYLYVSLVGRTIRGIKNVFSIWLKSAQKWKMYFSHPNRTEGFHFHFSKSRIHCNTAFPAAMPSNNIKLLFTFSKIYCGLNKKKFNFRLLSKRSMEANAKANAKLNVLLDNKLPHHCSLSSSL